MTTRQIDRIIDMERIRCLLQDKKAKKGITYFQLDKQGNGFHANVYEAKFIAKINQIAIERNIRHENSEDFGESFGQRQAKCAAKDKNYNQAYKYSKKYHLKTKSIAKEEEEDYQSISEIESNLEEFEVNLPNKRNRRVKRTRAVTTSGLKMWFRGMSTRFLERDRCKTSKAEVHEEY